MSLREGHRLGPYEILGALGAGGMGEVYRASDTKLKREVAIKVLPEAFARDEERIKRFEREAQVLDEMERAALDEALARAGGSPTGATRLLREVGRGRSSDPGGTVRAVRKRLNRAGSSSLRFIPQSLIVGGREVLVVDSCPFSLFAREDIVQTGGPSRPRRPSPSLVRRSYERTGLREVLAILTSLVIRESRRLQFSGNPRR